MKKRYRAEATQYILFAVKMIYAVKHAHGNINSAVHIKLAHILTEILYVFVRFFLCHTEHFEA